MTLFDMALFEMDLSKMALFKANNFLKAVFILSVLTLSSCSNYNLIQTTLKEKEKTESFPDWEDLMTVQPENYILKTNDKISLSIWDNEDLSVGSVFGKYNSNEVFGKWLLIDEQGEIALPQLGKVELANLSITEAEQKLSSLYVQEIINPIIILKVLNREITILGEVETPGNYLLEKNYHTLTELLGKAGGLASFANTKEISVIRNQVEYKMDLTKINPADLQRVAIETGDLIYVPSQKGKDIVQKSPALIPITSVITAAVLVLTAFNNK